MPPIHSFDAIQNHLFPPPGPKLSNNDNHSHDAIHHLLYPGTPNATMSPPLETIHSADKATLHIYNGHHDIHIGDIHTSHTSPVSMTAGLFTVKPGCSATTTFPFAEYKYVVSGNFLLTEMGNAPERRISLKAGDVFFIPKGSTIRFECEGEEGKAFFVAQREANEGRRAGLVGSGGRAKL